VPFFFSPIIQILLVKDGFHPEMTSPSNPVSNPEMRIFLHTLRVPSPTPAGRGPGLANIEESQSLLVRRPEGRRTSKRAD